MAQRMLLTPSFGARVRSRNRSFDNRRNMDHGPPGLACLRRRRNVPSARTPERHPAAPPRAWCRRALDAGARGVAACVDAGAVVDLHPGGRGTRTSTRGAGGGRSRDADPLPSLAPVMHIGGASGRSAREGSRVEAHTGSRRRKRPVPVLNGSPAGLVPVLPCGGDRCLQDDGVSPVGGRNPRAVRALDVEDVWRSPTGPPLEERAGPLRPPTAGVRPTSSFPRTSTRLAGGSSSTGSTWYTSPQRSHRRGSSSRVRCQRVGARGDDGISRSVGRTHRGPTARPSRTWGFPRRVVLRLERQAVPQHPLRCYASHGLRPPRARYEDAGGGPGLVDVRVKRIGNGLARALVLLTSCVSCRPVYSETMVTSGRRGTHRGPTARPTRTCAVPRRVVPPLERLAGPLRPLAARDRTELEGRCTTRVVGLILIDGFHVEHESATVSTARLVPAASSSVNDQRLRSETMASPG